jgi:hypothetical protein
MLEEDLGVVCEGRRMKRRSVKCSNKRGVVSSEKKMARGLREMNGTWETMLNFCRIT